MVWPHGEETNTEKGIKIKFLKETDQCSEWK